MKIEFDFAINKPKKRKRIMGIPADELKLYGSKEKAMEAAVEKDESVAVDVLPTEKELETKEE